jgi:hypothetical protein
MKKTLLLSFAIILNMFQTKAETSLRDSAMGGTSASIISPVGERRVNIVMMAVATNPFNFFWRQYPLSFDYITAKHAHEVRICYFDHSGKLLFDNSKTNFHEVRNTGIEASYTLKWMIRKASMHSWWYPYQGIQVRYGYRQWDPYPSVIVSKTEHTGVEDNVKSSSNYYDLCYIIGNQVRHKKWFMDMYAGGGIGYRTLVSNYDYQKYDIQSSPFIYKNWNTVYPAVRLGIRFGLID